MEIDKFLTIIIGLIERLGAISSILSLVITILILNEAKRIRKSFIQKIRIPEAYKLLAEISTTLSTSISSWPESKQEILKELSRTKSILINLKDKLDGNDKKQVEMLIGRLEKRRVFFQRKSIVDFSRDDLWHIYSALIAIVESLKQTEKDIRWR